ncbi:DUF6049 family protein [Dermacoccaceae bacterium W4C1]
MLPSLSSAAPPRARQLLILTLLLPLVLLLGLGPVPTGTLPALADDNDSDATFRVSISSITPTLVTDGSTVTISGQVRNNSSTALTGGTVRIGVADTSLYTRSAVEQWYTGTGTTSSIVSSMSTLGDVPLQGNVAPGGTATFTLQVPADDLPGGNRVRAVLPVRAQARTAAGTELATTRGTVIRAATGTSWDSPLQTSWMVPLTLPADPDLFGPSGEARTAAWRRAIGSGSRIDQLLTQLEGAQVTWVVDPTVVSPPLAPDSELTPRTDDGDDSEDSNDGDSATDDATATASASSPASATPSGTDSGAGSTQSAATPSTGTSTGASTDSPSSSASTSSSSTSTNPSTTSEPSTEPTTVEGLVAALRTRLQNRAASQPVWTLPTADPDLNALTATGGERSARAALTGESISAEAVSGISSGQVLWPVGDVSSATLTSLTRQWRSVRQASPTTVLSTRQVDGSADSSTSSAARRLSDGTTVLAYDEKLSRSATADGDPGMRTQRFLADSLASYLESPGTSRSVLVMAPRAQTASPAALAALITSAGQAPWLSTAAASTLRTQAGAAPADAAIRTTSGGTTPAASPLSRDALAETSRDRRRLGVIDDLLVDSDDIIDGWSAGLRQRTSARWRGHAASYSAVTQAQRNAIVQVPQKIQVRPSSVNFFTDSGEVPVVVVNQLRRPVHNVRLTLVPRRYLVEVREQPKALSVAADSNTTVRVPLRAVSAGRVQLDAMLSTTTGDPLGTPSQAPAHVSLNVRPTGSWLYWVLGLFAGPILVIGLIRAFRRGPRPDTEVEVGQADPGVSTSDGVGPAQQEAAPTQQDDHEGEHD